MRFRLLVPALLLLSAAPAFAQKVFIDYDKNYERGHAKTFAWVDAQEGSLKDKEPLMHSRIVNGVEHYLSMVGLIETDDNPDLSVTYYTSTEEELSISTTSLGYGYPGGWAYGGYYGAYGYPSGFGISGSTSTVSTYQVGTLVVDVWDNKSEKLVWRGMATNMTVSPNPAKMEKKIDTALKKMVAAWEKIVKKEERARQKAG